LAPDQFREQLEHRLKKKNTPIKSTSWDFLDWVEKKVLPTYPNANTQKSKRRNMNLLKLYRTETGNRVDFTFDAKDYDQLMEWQKSKNYKINTMGSTIKDLKVFLNKAIDHGLRVGSTRALKVVENDTDAIALNEDELNAMWDLKLTGHLEKARDMFLIGCFTGLRFVEFSRIHGDHVQGDRIIIGDTKKVGENITTLMLPITRAIYEKYNNNFPDSITNQKLNDYIKEVAKLLNGFDKKIEVRTYPGGVLKVDKVKKWKLVSTHTARRSFATMMYKMGAPSRSIMAVTGHKTEDSFRKYIKIEKDEHVDILFNIATANK